MKIIRRLRRKEKTGSGIFRNNKKVGKGENDERPSIQPSLTMTLSQDDLDRTSDSNNSSYSSVTILSRGNKIEEVFSPALQEKEDSKTVSFTEKQLMANSLRHIRQLYEKQQEVNQMKLVLDELKENHARNMEEKDQEIGQLKQEHQQEIQTITDELTDVKEDLTETKATLVRVSTVLIGCQQELYESSKRTGFYGLW